MATYRYDEDEARASSNGALNGGFNGYREAVASKSVDEAKAANAAAGVTPQRPEGYTPNVLADGKTSGDYTYTSYDDHHGLWTNKELEKKYNSGTGTAKKQEDPLDPAAEMWKSGYAPSQTVLDAQAYLRQQEQAIANKGPYTGSPYDDDIQRAYQSIMDRGPFRYNVNDDAIYQMYRNMYAENGRQASLNAQGQAAGLTGGYGNSYAAAAGNAAYDQYMQNLNDRAMDLYDRAYQRYQDEGTELQTKYAAARAMGDEDYSKWVDDYNRLQQERQYAYGKYGDEFTRDYGIYQNEQQMAYQNVLAMIQAGVTPSAQMRRNAGLSDEDYLLLKQTYKKKSSGGSGYRGPSYIPDQGYDPNVIKEGETTPAGQTDPQEQVYDYINALVNSGAITPDDGYQMVDIMKGNGGAKQTTGAAQTGAAQTGAAQTGAAQTGKYASTNLYAGAVVQDMMIKLGTMKK